jgi:8-oxo-dGTP pyrophosphatase MutT (NUDIX family)
MRSFRGLALPGAPAPDDAPAPRLAAVAAVVSADGDLLFIRRAERLGDPWSGHVAFPGGRHEPGDADTRETAMRETLEEIGLDLSGAVCLGVLRTLRSPYRESRYAMDVIPWVFHVDAWPRAFVSSEEVASVHRVPLARLLAGDGRGTFPWEGPDGVRTVPYVDLDGNRLWGMTLQAVDDLLVHLRAHGVHG